MLDTEIVQTLTTRTSHIRIFHLVKYMCYLQSIAKEPYFSKIIYKIIRFCQKSHNILPLIKNLSLIGVRTFVYGRTCVQ